MKPVSTILIVLLCFACSENPCREDAPPISGAESFDLIRKEKEFFHLDTKEEVRSFLEENPVISNDFFYAREYPNLDILSERIVGVINDPYIDTLRRESIEAFERNQAQLTSDLTEAFGRVHSLYPEKPVPDLHTFIGGLYNDIIVSRDTIVIGIDFFIGENATYRPTDFPEYIIKRYNYDYLAPTVVKFHLNDIGKLGLENTMLSEMIDHGKMYYLLSRVMPCTPDHEIFGYTEQEMIDVKANQETVWAHFLQNELLYETEEFTKKKYIGERPNVYEIGEKCPGRIGAWVGWQIVESYVDQTGIEITDLMELEDHHQIFAASNYKPRNVK